MKKIEHACVYSCNPTQTAVYFYCLCVTVTRSFLHNKRETKNRAEGWDYETERMERPAPRAGDFRTLLEDPVLAKLLDLTDRMGAGGRGMGPVW